MVFYLVESLIVAPSCVLLRPPDDLGRRQTRGRVTHRRDDHHPTAHGEAVLQVLGAPDEEEHKLHRELAYQGHVAAVHSPVGLRLPLVRLPPAAGLHLVLRSPLSIVVADADVAHAEAEEEDGGDDDAGGGQEDLLTVQGGRRAGRQETLLAPCGLARTCLCGSIASQQKSKKKIQC